jgi:F-type H+-transporting ATPase subunit a
MTVKQNKAIRWFIPLLILTFLAFSQPLFSSDEHSESITDTTQTTHKTNKFTPGEFIIDHIGNSHDWHIASFGETHISIPLPVILYSSHSGWSMFMSSAFHHGHEAFGPFQLITEGENKGKITETLTDGSTLLPLDLSITKNVLSLLFSLTILCWVFLSVAKSYSRREGQAPKGLQSLLEPLILFIRDDIAKGAIGEKKYERYMPFLLSVFFFIFINNLMGLIPIFPGGANLTGNIAITMILALFSFAITTFSGNKGYWLHIINAPGVPWWLKLPIPLMPLVEIIGVFTKPFVLMVRLFANITAGHIIVLGFFSLIFIFGEMNPFAGYGISLLSLLFAVFMTMLELLVAFIQAYVFTLLSAIYFGMAVEEHHTEAHH